MLLKAEPCSFDRSNKTAGPMMIVRTYIQSDWNDLCEIHDRARLDELKLASLENAYLPLNVAAKREGFFDYTILVAEQDGKVQSFIAFDSEEIAWLYADPKIYRRGVGKALLEKALTVRNLPVSIEVLQGNSSALNFCKRCGFKEVGMDSGLMRGNESYTVTVHILSYSEAV